MTYQRKLDELTRKLEPAARRAFLDAVDELVNAVQLNRFIAAIERGDVTAALDQLDIDRVTFARLTETLTATYSQAGATVVSSVTWRYPDMSKAVVRWDMQNQAALDWVRTLSSQRITEISNTTREAARVAIARGYERGMGPRQIALDVVGRIGANGRRSGGVLGLTTQQEGYVANMRARLASGDPYEMRKVLGMTLRDKRMDRSIIKAIDAGRPLSASQINTMVMRYNNKMLKHRGDVIARTETAAAVEGAKVDAFRQGLEKTGIPLEYVSREWLHAGPAKNGAERPEHVALHRTKMQGLDTPFVVGGDLMKYPHDTSLGAGADQVAGCRCSVFLSVDFIRLAT